MLPPSSLFHLRHGGGEEARGAQGSSHRATQSRGAEKAALRSPVPCLQPLAPHRALLRGAGKDSRSCGKC